MQCLFIGYFQPCLFTAPEICIPDAHRCKKLPENWADLWRCFLGHVSWALMCRVSGTLTSRSLVSCMPHCVMTVYTGCEIWQSTVQRQVLPTTTDSWQSGVRVWTQAAVFTLRPWYLVVVVNALLLLFLSCFDLNNYAARLSKFWAIRMGRWYFSNQKLWNTKDYIFIVFYLLYYLVSFQKLTALCGLLDLLYSIRPNSFPGPMA